MSDDRVVLDWNNIMYTNEGEKVRFLIKRRTDTRNCMVCLVESSDNGNEYVVCFNTEGFSVNGKRLSNENLLEVIDWDKSIKLTSGAKARLISKDINNNKTPYCVAFNVAGSDEESGTALVNKTGYTSNGYKFVENE